MPDQDTSRRSRWPCSGSRGWTLRRLTAAATVLAIVVAALAAGGATLAASRHPTAVTPSAQPPSPPATSPVRRRRDRLAAAASWHYQLRRIEIAEIAASPADLVVIDYAPDRVYGVELPFSREDVARMRRKPDGGARIVLAYLSIGEAERYRTYWNSAWYDPAKKPEWLLASNPRWDGNFLVRFWHPEWQRIVFGAPDAYLDRILAAGFDGVYLDRADVFQEVGGDAPGLEPERAMESFIVRLAAHARSLRNDAIVVMQNAEELIRHRAVRSALDGIAKEDLLHGVEHDERANDPTMVRGSLQSLRLARRSGLAVFAVEYLSSRSQADAAQERLRREGFIPLIAERSLGAFSYRPPRP